MTIYPVRPQPFITEVYLQTNTAIHNNKQNKFGYVAIEIYNPYRDRAVNGDASISLSDGWHVYAVSRPAGSDPYSSGGLQYEDLGAFPANTPALAAGQYAVIKNYKQGANDANAAQIRPDLLSTFTPANSIYMKDLGKGIGRELVLMRPAPVPSNTYIPGAGGQTQLAPVDQYDSTGLVLQQPPDPTQDYFAQSWHYTRETPSDAANGNRWRCVYPGRYDGNLGKTTRNDAKNLDEGIPRHQGTEVRSWRAADKMDGQTPPAVVPGAGAQNEPDPGLSLGAPSNALYDKVFTIQVANTDSPGPGAPGNGPPVFPYGGFARVGDIMQVPFIAGYEIKVGSELVEWNSVSMDSAFAEDTDVKDDGCENVGRFCPVWQTDSPPPDPFAALDWSTASGNWRYQWATKVFDYFTVQAPHDDFTPDLPGVLGESNKTPIANAEWLHINDNFERTVGAHGLININTAPWRVLAAVPFLPPDPTLQPPKLPDDANRALAQAIVRYREQNGPFRNLFDLYRVPEFRQSINNFASSPNDPDDDDGDITPGGVGNVDHVRGDFEEQYLLLNRVSNLITTRSDSFTCYLLVQGWKYAGSNNPQLVVQRRLGVYIDRSGSTVNRNDIKVQTFPVD